MRLLFLTLMLVCAQAADALDSVPEQSQLPAGFREVRAGDLQWMPNPAAPRGEMALLFGAPGSPAPYAIRVRLPAGGRMMPHTHPEPRTYTVIAGEWKLGFGGAFDKSALRSYAAGSVYRLPAGVPHFHAVERPDTIVQIEGIGPTATNYVNPAHDPRVKQHE